MWCPAFGQMEHLYGEYEVNDYKDGVRYLNFAYLRHPHKIAIEIDGYGPHCRDIDRRGFADRLLRQNHLILDHWLLLRFSLDDVKEHPRQCQQMIQQMLGMLYSHSAVKEINLHQREIIRIVSHHVKPVSPSEISALLGISTQFARKLMQELVTKKFLMSASQGERVRYYRIGKRKLER
ncbi:DNA-binding response regulator [Paenibacillus glycanilyticus]|uniref:DNA-binding response regulator n=1 Tax=Paenibacillus glycanilyticus TaxID=126569 RepID=UPI00203D9D3B|nr:DNA-binding response regulator [Paenibacillus glycanilyticus]MCM3630685.1 DNA-binding response regulator [Paenibacillus glycanilyticus]